MLNEIPSLTHPFLFFIFPVQFSPLLLLTLLKSFVKECKFRIRILCYLDITCKLNWLPSFHWRNRSSSSFPDLVWRLLHSHGMSFAWCTYALQAVINSQANINNNGIPLTTLWLQAPQVEIACQKSVNVKHLIIYTSRFRTTSSSSTLTMVCGR